MRGVRHPRSRGAILSGFCSTWGAPFGGTTRGAHHGVDSDAFSLMTPPNFGGCGGSCRAVMVVAATLAYPWPVGLARRKPRTGSGGAWRRCFVN